VQDATLQEMEGGEENPQPEEAAAVS